MIRLSWILVFFLIRIAVPHNDLTAATPSSPNDTIFIKADTIRMTDTVVIVAEEKKKLHINLKTYINPMIPAGKYGSTSSLTEDLADYYNNERKGLPSFSLGTQAGVEYGKWMSRMGLAYTVFREQVDHAPTNVIISKKNYFQTDTLDEYFRVYQGDTTWIYATQNRQYSYIDTTYLNTPYTNRYSYFEIPFSVGYSLKYSKFSYILNTGIIAGFYIKRLNQRNVYVEQERSLQFLNEQNAMKRFNFSVFLSVEISYYYSEKFDFFVEPMIKKHINSFFRSTYPYHYSPASIGLKAGFKYYFNIEKPVKK